MDFVVGDAPVVLHNQWCRGVTQTGSTGLACSGLQIFLPLSPKHLAILYDTDIYWVGESQPDVADVDTDAEVQALNCLQYAAAESTLYYSCPETAPHIDALPTSGRDGGLGVLGGRFKEEDTTSHLIVVSHVPLDVDLVSGTIRIKDEMRAVPPGRRVQRWREEALAMTPDREERKDRPRGPRGSRRYIRVDD